MEKRNEVVHPPAKTQNWVRETKRGYRTRFGQGRKPYLAKRGQNGGVREGTETVCRGKAWTRGTPFGRQNATISRLVHQYAVLHDLGDGDKHLGSQFVSETTGHHPEVTCGPHKALLVRKTGPHGPLARRGHSGERVGRAPVYLDDMGAGRGTRERKIVDRERELLHTRGDVVGAV